MKKMPLYLKAGLGLAVISFVINGFIVVVLGSTPLGFLLFLTALPTMVLGYFSDTFVRCTENMFAFVVMTSVLYFFIGCAIAVILQRIRLPKIVAKKGEAWRDKPRPIWINAILLVVIAYSASVLLLVRKDLDPTTNRLFLDLIKQVTYEPRTSLPILIALGFLAALGLVYDRRIWTRIVGFIGIAFFTLNVFTVFFYLTSSLPLDMANVDKRDAQPLLKALDDRNWSVRSDAAKALGDLGDKRAVDPLIRALSKSVEEHDSVRGSAASALGKLGDIRAVPYLIKALGDDYLPVRMGAASSLGELGDERATEALIELLVNDEDPRVRWNAAGSLGEIGDERATEALAKALLKDEDKLVRYRAAEALEKIGDSRALEPLITAIRDDDMRVPRSVVAEALVKIGEPSVEPLINVLKKDKDKHTRCSAAWALGRIKDTRAIEPLIAQLEDEDKDVRNNTSTALLYITGRSFRNAARAYKWLEQYKVAEQLIPALKDGNRDVQHNAAEALAKIDGPAVKALTTLLSDENTQARYWAVWALGNIESSEATRPLIVALKDQNKEIRCIAIKALANKRGDCVVEALVATLKDEDQDIQCEAAEALRHKTGKDFGGDAVKWQQWWERKKESFHK